MRKFYFLIILVLGIFWANQALAHQPRLIKDTVIVKVNNPEVSQAFYGILNGSPQYFLLNEKKEFSLYLNILVPYLPDAKKDFLVEVFKGSKDEQVNKLFYLAGSEFKWTYFYEEYGGDAYWQGPELKKPLPAGEYLIKLSNPQNSGKYSLAIGEKEEFPPNEIFNTLIVLPQIKVMIFNKSPWSAFTNKIGRYLGTGLLLILVLILIIILVVRKIRGK